jgi:hypothetical protein
MLWCARRALALRFPAVCLVSFAAFAFHTTHVFAQHVHFVSESGDDDAAGTQSQPLLSIREAVQRAKQTPGTDSILLKRGEVHRNYAGQGDSRLNGLRIGAYGTGKMPRVVGTRGIEFSGYPMTDLVIEDLVILGEPRDPNDPTSADGGITVRAADRGYNLLIHRCMIIGGDLGISIASIDRVRIERCIIARNFRSGILAGRIAGLTVRDTAIIYNGWRRDIANQETRNVLIDRSMFVHNENCAWKAERGGTVRDSLFIGHPVQIGLGSGTEYTQYVQENNPFTSIRNVYAAACETVAIKGGRVTAVQTQGIGDTIFRSDLIGPPITFDGRDITTPFNQDDTSKYLSLRTPDTVILGYGRHVETDTQWPRWAGIDTWDDKITHWLETDTFPDIAAERTAAALTILTGW